MTHAARRHRALDHAFAHAIGEAGQTLLRSRDGMKDLRTMASARVLLTTLSVRTSAKGRSYLSGFLGKSRVVAFAGEPDKFGNATWDVFVAAPEPRDDAHAVGPAGTAYRAPRREGARAQQERAAGEVLRDYGDEEMSDAIPF